MHLKDIPWIKKEINQRLEEGGYTKVEDLKLATKEELVVYLKLDDQIAETLIRYAKKYFEYSEGESKIKLEEYTDGWKNQFLEEKKRIERELDGCIIHIEHIGSTAIPNIMAKPIVDIMIGYLRIKDKKKIKKALKSIGYNYEHKKGSWILFNIREEKKKINLHLVPYSEPFWNKQIAFRNYLKAHSNEAKAYDQLKRNLTEKYRTIQGYTNGKTKFIEKILDKVTYSVNDNSISEF